MTETTAPNIGTVTQVIGSTLDAEFDPEHMPAIGEYQRRARDVPEMSPRCPRDVPEFPRVVSCAAYAIPTGR